MRTRYLEPIREPFANYEVVYPERSLFRSSNDNLVNSFKVGLERFQNLSLEQPESGSSPSFGVHPRTAQYLEAWNGVSRVGANLINRTNVLNELGVIFDELSVECTYVLPRSLSSDIASQNALIACKLAVDDISVTGLDMPSERIGMMREALSRGYGFIGQHQTTALVFTGLSNQAELLQSVHRRQ